ncbi:MAG: DUF3106 domain-containing protein, partial [Candidatus Binatia bacterium]
MTQTQIAMGWMTEMKNLGVKICLICFLGFLPASSLAGAADWRNLTPKEKDRVQRNYQRWEKLPPQDKNHLREEWDRYQRLPPDERE